MNAAVSSAAKECCAHAFPSSVKVIKSFNDLSRLDPCYIFVFSVHYSASQYGAARKLLYIMSI